jgi:hypothetical protein
MKQRTRGILVATAAVLGIAAYVVTARPGGPISLRTFEPDRLAALELDMWQAYYRRERLRLFRDLVTTLREQYHCSYASAAMVGFRFGRAASTFASSGAAGGQVLPDLEKGYTILRACVNGTFDAAAVARAELAWWVARRTPGQQAPEYVGALIADENALLFGVRRERLLDASVLRARAGRLRDDGGEQADWGTVRDLLQRSYRALHAAVN